MTLGVSEISVSSQSELEANIFDPIKTGLSDTWQECVLYPSTQEADTGNCSSKPEPHRQSRMERESLITSQQSQEETVIYGTYLLRKTYRCAYHLHVGGICYKHHYKAKCQGFSNDKTSCRRALCHHHTGCFKLEKLKSRPSTGEIHSAQNTWAVVTFVHTISTGQLGDGQAITVHSYFPQ